MSDNERASERAIQQLTLELQLHRQAVDHLREVMNYLETAISRADHR